MRSLVARKLAEAGKRCGVIFAVRLADGTRLASRPGDPAFTFVFRNARAELRTAVFGHVGLLESYFDGDLDVEGSLRQAFVVGFSGGLDEIRRRHLEGALDVIETDFRDARTQYDKVVSIGTLEHAGRDQLDEVVRAHAAFLKPGGLGMLHFIGHVGRSPTEFFIRKHVFPGGWIPGLADVIVAMEKAGLEVVDIENLRR